MCDPILTELEKIDEALCRARARRQGMETKKTEQAAEPRDWLSAIEARVDAATQGPWTTIYRNKAADPGWVDGIEAPRPDPTHLHMVQPIVYADRCYMAEPADMEFMASARVDIPRLVSEIQYLRAMIEGGYELMDMIVDDRGGWSRVDPRLADAAKDWRFAAAHIAHEAKT